MRRKHRPETTLFNPHFCPAYREGFRVGEDVNQKESHTHETLVW